MFDSKKEVKKQFTNKNPCIIILFTLVPDFLVILVVKKTDHFV